MKYTNLCHHPNKYEQVNVGDFMLNVNAILRVTHEAWACKNNVSDHNMEL